MEVSLLNVLVVFQKNAVESDSIGNRTNSWADYYSCHATVSGEAGKLSSESETAGIVADNSDISFTVRWCKKVSVIDSTGYRILFENEIYDILAVDHMNYKKKCVKFKCRKARR
ncbi:MAG: phage head closure protein [Clostridium sp.]|nr:phage head closure protein [Clostridium sp.]MCM1534630.1 phage head closure protein [Clostridium sp.]